ncbi:hypothetical protein [Pseudooceanicola sp. HF7]|uniref:hypothetical protein n=1 Tax=Pseudooceanicola sp. HF7 TaxID=2721560 RepID=UPI001430B14F|nr:hypothetical protein [Pseudooceanicola sp. HF7]NIZ09806.1 hypothetical protein [Pseudooceanicola sp. HF7]
MRDTQAVSGHKTLSMGQTYTHQANNKPPPKGPRRQGNRAETKQVSADKLPNPPEQSGVGIAATTIFFFEIKMVRVKGLEPPRQRRQNLNLAII